MNPRARELKAVVNGSAVVRRVDNRTTLAELLREELGLTGTKVSCELQVCGVCTVLVDGTPVSSCTYLAADADGKHVQTVEGLAGPDGLHPLQTAFVENFALQCGFCTPGFLLMAKALLDTNPNPTEEEVVHHLEGNICRCTGYRPIVDAVLSVAAGERGE
ncbi:(2Fe-2S)-binding protein [Amycolatopsis sp. FDAARGOS 1241]|uniref:(2Fe-2S)-binding protein n=1 Tax=Amycolatopsis sp. FDAARGOS 1241 TaxID=2778070 RepID=UPI00194FC77D|nr:(2Fe-2S)-binding protein [Amycolatopsis sp. FDAARGOS 1241]QRP48657.1 (2Fe-2S)-binding protein [Amycolatopsis sp. FDAARGOS 1241]